MLEELVDGIIDHVVDYTKSVLINALGNMLMQQPPEQFPPKNFIKAKERFRGPST